MGPGAWRRGALDVQVVFVVKRVGAQGFEGSGRELWPLRTRVPQ